MQACARRSSPSLRLIARTYASAAPSTSGGRGPFREVAPPPPAKPKPTSATFFTGRASYNDAVLRLEDAIKEAQYSLRRAHLLEPSSSAFGGNAPTQGRKKSRQTGLAPQWKNAEDMGRLFDAAKKLPTGSYRRIISLLGELNEYRSILQHALSNPATSARLLEAQSSPSSTESAFSYPLLAPETRAAPRAPMEIFRILDGLVSQYQRASFQADLLRQQAELAERGDGSKLEDHVLQPIGAKARKGKAHVDEVGRVYAMGRRKESSARVWVVPARTPKFKERDDVKTVVSEEGADAAAVNTSAHQRYLETLKSSFSSSNTNSSLYASPLLTPSPSTATLTPLVPQILINNTPLHLYFPNPADREKVVFPFKATGTVGKYNVFALVRGGGTTGQAGAIALGVSRAVELLGPRVRGILSSYDLLRRDSRMVERKKTGQPKARKRYTWVKR